MCDARATQASKRDMRALLGSRAKWVVCHASSAYRHALKEVLADPALAAVVSNTHAAAEVRALGEFFGRLSAQPDRVTYGLRFVEAAAEQSAVETLLVADTLFRANNVATRARYVALVESVRSARGAVHIFSSLHVSGEQLAGLSGVAALLRFPIPDVEAAEALADAAGDDRAGSM